MESYKIYAFIIFAFQTLSSIAQPVSSPDDNLSKIYVKVYGGFGFITPGSFRGKQDLTTNTPAQFRVPKLGMGAGVRTGAGIGFILNEFINLGIDGEYLLGKKMELNGDLIQARSGVSAFNSSTESAKTYEYKVFSLIPNIVFKAISKPKYYVYNRLGVVFGFPVSVKESFYQHYHYKNNGDYTYDPHTTFEKDKIDTYYGIHTLKPALGYQFSLGTQVSFSAKLKGFFEVTAYGISFDRDKYEDTQRLEVLVVTNKYETLQPTTYDHSRYIFEYINSGATGTNVKGVPFNYVTTVRYAQDPVIMNTITAGLGIAYRF